MALIKHKSAVNLVNDAAVYDLTDLTLQAEVALEQARVEARLVVVNAQRQAAAIVEAANQRGFEEGHDEGRREGYQAGKTQGRDEAFAENHAQLQELTRSFIAVLEEWEHQRHHLMLSARQDVLTLALTMGEKVAHRLVEVDPTIITDQLAAAVSRLIEPSAVSIIINPADRPAVEAALPDLVDRLGQAGHVQMRDDASITPGGCRIHTERGQIDATIEQQIERIVSTLIPAIPAPTDPAPPDGVAEQPLEKPQ